MASVSARDAASLWHPFTQHSSWASEPPLVVTSAQGSRLVDEHGREYVDGVSSLWVTVHGHREPAIDEAVRRQLDKVAHTTFLGLTHEPAVELAERLLATVPTALSRVFYAGDGSSAVEVALKMAYHASLHRGHPRRLFVRLEGGYHGDTIGAVSVGGIAAFHATYEPLLFETRQVSSPAVRPAGQSPAVRAAHALAELAALFARDGDQIAAVVVEPLVQAAAGILTYHPSFLTGARALCDAYGALLVVDEVATGVGRTGTMWACEQAGVTPDLLTCGKGLSGGYLPIAAVLATEQIYEAFLGGPERTFFHGHTYTANPLACAAAVANLRLMDERATLARAVAVGERIGAALEPLAKEPFVREVRRLGTMTGIDLGGFGDRVGARVCRLARDRGVVIRPLGDVVVLMPPLGIPDDDLATLLEVTTDCVVDVAGGA